MKEATLDERVALLAKIPREIYEHGRGIGEALELVLAPEDGNIVANFFNYDWSNRKRESENPRYKLPLLVTPSKTISLDGIYEKLVPALVGEGYFVEEINRISILIQPLTAEWAYINALVNNFIGHLKATKSPLLERPKISDSEEAYKEWLTEYHRVNDMDLPRGFNTRNKEQLRGMFMGITEPEKIERGLRERQFVIEFYKAHGALLPEGFDTWEHKQVKFLNDKLNRWYGNEHVTQPDLFRR